jgi:hypothetical protein
MSKLHFVRQGQQLSAAVAFALLLSPGTPAAEPVAVRYPDGAVHGFLVLRAPNGNVLADGDLNQTVRGDRVTARLVFRFKDGSLHEQTTVYSQRRHIEFISDHIVQKGPAFPYPLDMSIDGASGQVTVRYRNERGMDRSESDRLDLPDDLANGLVGKLLMNADPEAIPRSLSLVVPTPAPRLVKLLVAEAGSEHFSVGGSSRQATRYVLKVDIGGLAGVLAPLFGKQPPDSFVWIAREDVPAFVRADQPLYAGGPVWSIELAGPVWPRTAAAQHTAANSE